MAKVIKSETGNLSRVPPQNIDAERSVLGAMMLDGESCFKALDILQPEHFYLPGHQTVFEIIKELFVDKNTPADLLMVTNRLKEIKKIDDVGGAGYLSGLVNVVATVENMEHHARIVRDKALLRECIHTATKMSDWSYGEELDVDEVIERASGEFLNLTQRRDNKEFTPMEYIAQDAYDRIMVLKGRGFSDFLKTGFSDFDKEYHGFYPGEYVVIAARPSVGKTSWALNVATNLAREGKNVAIFSLEMPAEHLATRIISGLSGVPAFRMITGEVNDSQLEKIRNTAAIIKDWGIYIDDTPALSPLKIRTRLKRLLMRNNGKIDIVIIDYLQLLEADRSGRYENRVVEVSSMSRSLKALAREVNIPVVVLAQLSRSIEQHEKGNRDPRLSDLRESGAIEQDADKVLFLHRVKDSPNMEKDEEHFKWKGRLWNISEDGPTPIFLYVAKNRNGPTGQMLLAFDPELMRFNEYNVRTSVLESKL